MLMQGLCCVRDIEGGFRFLRRAALQEEPNAMLYFAQVLEDGVCSLASWQTNSHCTHAVSDVAEGPYVFADVAVGHWCHNSAAVVEKQADGSQLWALFHIGTGAGGAIKNCTQQQQQRSSFSSAATSSTLHTSPSPSGPWTPTPPPLPCNNPAPFAAQTALFLVCNGFTLYSCPSVAAAAAGTPWTLIVSLKSNPSQARTNTLSSGPTPAAASTL